MHSNLHNLTNNLPTPSAFKEFKKWILKSLSEKLFQIQNNASKRSNQITISPYHEKLSSLYVRLKAKYIPNLKTSNKLYLFQLNLSYKTIRINVNPANQQNTIRNSRKHKHRTISPNFK